MPSLHIGWSLWCAFVLVKLARRTWVKVLGALLPDRDVPRDHATTANHFILDAAGGVLALALGFGIQRLLSGAAGVRAADPPLVPSPRPEPRSVVLRKPSSATSSPRYVDLTGVQRAERELGIRTRQRPERLVRQRTELSPRPPRVQSRQAHEPADREPGDRSGRSDRLCQRAPPPPERCPARGPAPRPGDRRSRDRATRSRH